MKSRDHSEWEKLLHAWELGMLDEADRERLEEHLIGCESCAEEVLRFEAAARLLRHNDTVKRDVRGQAADRVGAGWTLVSSRWRSTRLIPAFGLGLVVILVLVLGDWQLEFRPTQEAVAIENRLAVMYLANETDPDDPERLGEIATNLLITDLSESHYLGVVSSQRLYDILKSLGHEGEKSITPDLATEVARKARARWMLTGGILQTAPYLVVTVQIVDVMTGEVVAAHRTEGEPDDDIFALVDRMTPDVRLSLGLPAEAQEERDRPVAEMTTGSPEAYRYYLMGMDAYHGFNFEAAERDFLAAVALDSTFALAYFRLAYGASQMFHARDHHRFLEKANQYIGQAGQEYQYLIRGYSALMAGDTTRGVVELENLLERFQDNKEARYRLGLVFTRRGQYDRAIELHRTTLDTDPFFEPALNQLAYDFAHAGMYDSALRAAAEYISKVPDKANPWDTRADIHRYMKDWTGAVEAYRRALEVDSTFHAARLRMALSYRNAGRLDEAVRTYHEYLDRKPDRMDGWQELGLTYLLNRDYLGADSCWRIMASSDKKSDRSMGRYLRALVPLRQGKYEETLRAADDAVAAVRVEGVSIWWTSHLHFLKAVVYGETGRIDLSIAETEKAIEVRKQVDPGRRDHGTHLLVLRLAQDGQIEQAREALKTLEWDVPYSYRRDLECRVWFARGVIEYYEGRYDSSAALLEMAVQADSMGFVAGSGIRRHYLLARAYQEAGRTDTAIGVFKTILSDFGHGQATYAPWSVKSHYYLARAYEETDRRDRAAEQYRIFLDLWSEADTGIVEIDDARRRLARLGNI